MAISHSILQDTQKAVIVIVGAAVSLLRYVELAADTVLLASVAGHVDCSVRH